MSTKKKKRLIDTTKKEKVFFVIVFSLFFIAFVWTIIRVIISITNGKSISEYGLILTQTTIGMALLLVPSFLERAWKLDVPEFINLFVIIFVFCALFLGEVGFFYYRVPFFDKFVHIGSGLLLGAVSFTVIQGFNQKHFYELDPLFVAIFSFMFAMALGALWEIFEFTVDSFGFNMQKYRNIDKVDYVGRAALMDTMLDLLVDAIGAIAMSILGFISVKFKKGWVEKLIIKKAVRKDSDEEDAKKLEGVDVDELK